MSITPDDRAHDLRTMIPAPRRSPEQLRILIDDQLIEAVRMDRVTHNSPLVARMLAAWRRSVLA